MNKKKLRIRVSSAFLAKNVKKSSTPKTLKILNFLFSNHKSFAL